MKYTIIKKFISITLALSLVFMPLTPVLAEETTEIQSTEQNFVTPPPEVTPPPTFTQEDSTQPESEATITPPPSITQPPTLSQPASSAQQVQEPTGSGSGNVGETSLLTGDASSNSNTSITGNTNISSTGGSSSDLGSVTNSSNGASTINNGASASTATTDTTQGNGAIVGTAVNSATVTGNSQTSYNVGDSQLQSGDANTTGTVLTNVNSNLSGVTIAEFNIVDDHTGDYVLDFGEHCISGCAGTGVSSTTNTDNGANSQNNTSTTSSNSSTTGQTNTADVSTDMVLVADSGNNDASLNTGGDSTIQTGDANVAANVATFVNNNVSGNVYIGVVNIFGDLIGDIILPDDPCASGGCASGTTASTSGNGANSSNSTNTSSNSDDQTFQVNDASIENNLILDANSGSNSTDFSTGGDTSVQTGETSVDANVVNISNLNMSGGTFWLVLVNNAGQWIGKIMGSEDGSNFGGSEGTQFVIDENGQVIVVNDENGAGSTNNANASSSESNTTNQSNTARVLNNLDLRANTGNNTANYNTGGDSTIQTGDAVIIANLVNFINNNIVGNGKLIVTFINVFGSWQGDFIGPGQSKRTLAHSPQGGSSQQSQSQSSTENTNDVYLYPGENMIHQKVGTFQKQVVMNSIIPTETNESGVLAITDASQIKTAGISTNDPLTKEQVLSINLAWGVFLLPIAGIYLLRKRRLKGKIAYA